MLRAERRPPAASSDLLDIELHSGQWEAWESKARWISLASGRRWGKSQFGVWWALRQSRGDHVNRVTPSIGWYIAPTYKVARPVWRKFLHLAPKGWITKISGTERIPDSLDIGNAKIEFKTAENPETLVGEGLRWVWIDEAAIVDEQVWKESVRPAMMDYGGPGLFTGTPKGKNWFHRMAARGRDPAYPNYATFGGPSHENPWIDKDELKDIEKDLPERLLDQEIYAEFLDDEGEVFRNVNAARDAALELYPKSNGYCHHDTFVIGVDLARLVDFTVLYGICRQGHPTGFDRFKDIHWPLQKQRIVQAHKETGALLVVDASGIGDVVVQDLEHAGCRVLAVKTGAQKIQLIDALSVALDSGQILLPNEAVILDEIKAFSYTTTIHGNIRYNAPSDMHDDCVIAVALAAFGLLNAPPPVKLWSMAR